MPGDTTFAFLVLGRCVAVAFSASNYSLSDEYVLHEARFGSKTDAYLFDSGEDVCEGHDYDDKTCASFGCCTFDDGSCWSSVGQKMCGTTEEDTVPFRDSSANGNGDQGDLADSFLMEKDMSVADAQILCNDSPGCLGFTFEGRAPDVYTRRHMLFKKSADVGKSGWTTYVHKGVQTTAYDASKNHPFRFRGNLNSVRSEEVPDQDSLYDGAVLNLVGQTFKATTQEKKKDVLVNLFASWCGFCQKFKPVYRELARGLRHVEALQIAQMDATKNVVENVEIHSFPTIILFPAGDRKDQPLRYAGKRHVKDLMHWLHEHATHGDFPDTLPNLELQSESEGILGDSEDL